MKEWFIRLLVLSCALAVSLPSWAQEGKFSHYKYSASDGVERPYIVYTGKGLNESERRPLIVYLHGAISNPNLPNAERSAKRSVMNKLADEGGYYVLYVFGQKGAGWFDTVGLGMIMGEMEEVKRTYPIDDSKVFLGGFSDGASGTMYIAATHGAPFAGYIALNGSISVSATLGASPVYLDNINHKPMYIVNTLSDFLYPVKMMQPTIDKMRQYHRSIIYRTPEGNHDPLYFPSLQGEVRAFVDSCTLRPAHTISWESSDSLSNQYDWLRISAISEEAPAQWHKPYSMVLTNDKASLGVSPSPKHQGTGMVVGSFGKKSCLRDAGIAVGDTILKLDSVLLTDPRALFGYVGTKRAGEPFTATVLKDGVERVIELQFPPAYDYEVFTRQPLSAKVEARLEGNTLHITTSRARTITLDLDRLPLAKPKQRLTIICNGKTIIVKKPRGLYSVSI